MNEQKSLNRILNNKLELEFLEFLELETTCEIIYFTYMKLHDHIYIYIYNYT